MARHFHVTKNGCDSWSGTEQRPFLTIQRAADLACAGDVITVHEGIYREHVNPIRGGLDEDCRIVYEAAQNERVVISGAEEIQDWEDLGNGIYRCVLPNTFFGAFNPYKEIIWGDWFLTKDRIFHLGEVYFNGKSLFETDTMENLRNPEPVPGAREPDWSRHVWYCETDDQNTTIYMNLGELSPKGNTIEINVRKFCFWPEKTGINYITVRGFYLTMAAPNWAPPTALQEGLIGPHWSKGWIIENNEISNSKNSGISLGKDQASGHNQWSLLSTKHGTQRERDVIFSAFHQGWSRETVGSHIVRNNIIHDCEQTGICGHLGEVFSQIYRNHIYNIHHKRQYNGAEVAGIKLHASLDCQIYANHIHNCDRGLWMDWQAQGTRISRNLLYDNDTEDLFVEVSHGPYLVDNNIFLSMKAIFDLSQGGAYVHNLIAGYIDWARVPNRFTPYHYPHETSVHGLMTILGGDDRFYNNIFTGTLPENGVKEKKLDPQACSHSAAASQKNEKGFIPKGLSIYDECPVAEENWYQNLKTVDDFAAVRLPMHCGYNLYLHDARPFCKEQDSMACPEITPELTLTQDGGHVFLMLNLHDAPGIKTVCVTTTLLGSAFESEAPFENPDGTPLCVEYDFWGNPRSLRSAPGPFDHLPDAGHRIQLL